MINKDFLYAVVGVSNNEEKYGHKVFKDLLDAGYKVIPINPNEKKIMGEKVYPTLLEVKKIIDVVIFVTPPAVTEKVLEQVKALKEDIKGYFLVNRVDERKMLAKQIDEVLNDFGLPVLKARLHDYTAYENTLLNGLGVLEGSNLKAKNDVIQLTKEINKILSL